MLMRFVLLGEILHSLLHGEISNAAGALRPERTVQRECLNYLYVKPNWYVKDEGCIHSSTYPDVSLSVACENSTTGGFDMVVEMSTGLHKNWLLALVGPVPLMAGAGWCLVLVMY